MKKIVFLASGGGGNLAFIYLVTQRYLGSSFEVAGVISDRDCKAMHMSHKLGIPACEIKFNKDFSSNLTFELDRLKPDIIITNIHRILGPDLVLKYEGKLINLHYSFLPLFGGMIGEKPVRKAVESGCRFVGTTTHFISNEVDAGKIIAQSITPIKEAETFENLMNRVFRAGCINLLNSISILSGIETRFSSGDIFEEMLLAPWAGLDKDWFSEDFWVALRKLNA